MEYQSPFGANFNVEDSLLRLENSFAESRRRSSPKNSSLDAECWRTDQSPSHSWRRNHSPSHGWRRDHSPSHGWRNRGSHYERHRSFDFDYGHRRNHSMRHRQVEGSSPRVEMHYHPSMLEDPWRELEQNLTEAAGVCSSRENSGLSDERRRREAWIHHLKLGQTDEK